MKHFEELKVDVTPERIYMKEERELKKHKDINQILREVDGRISLKAVSDF